jgi:broad specificity phosphatase PhoE
LTEQQFGNFQNLEAVTAAKLERIQYGRFYYRFPLGESGLDVYNRSSSFMQTFHRDWADRSILRKDNETNIVIVTHGLTMRLLLMRWFHFTVGEFERSDNSGNGEFVLMERSENKSKRREEVENNISAAKEAAEAAAKVRAQYAKLGTLLFLSLFHSLLVSR